MVENCQIRKMNTGLGPRPPLYSRDTDTLLTVLKGPLNYARTSADEIAGCEGRAFHRSVTNYLRSAMDLFDQDSVINIVHYWLSVKQLPLDPRKIEPEVFRRFNEKYKERINELAFVHHRLGFQ